MAFDFLGFFGGVADGVTGYLAQKEANKMAQKQLDQQRDAIEDSLDILEECCDSFPAYGDPASVYGTKPEVIEFTATEYIPTEYNKVLLCAASLASAQCNIDNFDTYSELVTKTDAFHLSQDKDRINSLVEGYEGMNARDLANTGDLIKGILPFSDALDIVSDTNTFHNAIGTAGCNMIFTAQDLGVKRLSLQAEGHQRLISTINKANQISSPQRQMNIMSMFVSPMEYYNAEMATALREYEVNFANNLGQYKANLANESEERKNLQLQAEIEASPSPEDRGMSFQALECCYQKATTQAALAGIAVATPTAGETGWGMVSNLLSKTSTQDFIGELFKSTKQVTASQVTPEGATSSISMSNPATSYDKGTSLPNGASGINYNPDGTVAGYQY